MSDLVKNTEIKVRPKDYEYIYGYDFGNGDTTTFIQGYKDKDGKIVIIDVKHYE